MTDFGNYLKFLIARSGLSQRQFVAATQSSLGTLQLLLSGARPPVDPTKNSAFYRKVSKVTNASSAEIDRLKDLANQGREERRRRRRLPYNEVFELLARRTSVYASSADEVELPFWDHFVALEQNLHERFLKAFVYVVCALYPLPEPAVGRRLGAGAAAEAVTTLRSFFGINASLDWNQRNVSIEVPHDQIDLGPLRTKPKAARLLAQASSQFKVLQLKLSLDASTLKFIVQPVGWPKTEYLEITATLLRKAKTTSERAAEQLDPLASGLVTTYASRAFSNELAYLVAETAKDPDLIAPLCDHLKALISFRDRKGSKS